MPQADEDRVGQPWSHRNRPHAQHRGDERHEDEVVDRGLAVL
jgi:hypothetical protein